jgi:hypothetical protein
MLHYPILPRAGHIHALENLTMPRPRRTINTNVAAVALLATLGLSTRPAPRPVKTLTIVPAYGRKYATRDFLLADWAGGKDFKIFDGPYLSIRDVPKLRAAGYTHLHIISNAASPEYFTEQVEL